MRKYLTVLLAVLSLLLCSVTAFASDGSVSYNGNAKDFIVTPGSDYSETDLFPDFKDVLPGETYSQKITIQNDASKEVKIKVYMRALGAHPDSVDFLSQLQLRVETPEENVLFDAPANQRAQLSNWVYLGTLYSGGKVELNVLLDVPVTLDNRYSNVVGYLDWEFAVEELPVEPTDPNVPQTGDTQKLGLYVALCVVSAVVIVVLFRKKKKS